MEEPTALLEEYSAYCIKQSESESVKGFIDWLQKSHEIVPHGTIQKCVKTAWSKILTSDFTKKRIGLAYITMIAMLFGKDVFIRTNSRLRCSENFKPSGNS